jgi:hypothetical protein
MAPNCLATKGLPAKTTRTRDYEKGQNYRATKSEHDRGYRCYE